MYWANRAMANLTVTPGKSLTHALLKVKPSREQFEQFKTRLAGLVAQINDSPNESEEHHKNHISDFLKYAFKFPAYFINTSDRIDLVIHNGKSSTDTVGVIIEAKRPGNQAEMPSQDNLNVKAMQELVLYYLRERIAANNLAVKHLAITNGYEWFIFDANVFEKAFAQNKALVKQFTEFEAGHLSGNTTDFFYKEIAKPAIEKMGDVEFTHFDLREKSSDKKLIALFKPLSPEHLLKLPFVNDSNSLNKDFYSELLHIIGLIEVKDGSKKLIQRKNEGERKTGELKDDNKALINASVLGLIFEKINGYKDGSFFTPGVITMYMCRETLRRAVLNKLNKIKELECKYLADLEEVIASGAGEQQESISQRVDKILANKQANLKTDTFVLDNEIDQIVYALYDLTPAEIALVEGTAVPQSPAMEEVSA